eukprot:CAMPEP_0115862102 /NCGR_PEP_ID=MMETSP0287-20121206/18002_1 /TAXON_ID=412157 /ORGANISM="Chrysochromulina rotalis, Strain UIO044" /LENGTH=66 /DNA_ID=CAMNT_0003316511 /DNA_START=816 /DNA_END=1016 /DNA_ORIENTATION=+
MATASGPPLSRRVVRVAMSHLRVRPVGSSYVSVCNLIHRVEATSALSMTLARANGSQLAFCLAELA